MSSAAKAGNSPYFGHDLFRTLPVRPPASHDEVTHMVAIARPASLRAVPDQAAR
ncbi:MAG TPA: hypothetical protein VFO01_09215 [Trebonia sp.]|nr:hypothetical protein [Trebonia sp.]